MYCVLHFRQAFCDRLRTSLSNSFAKQEDGKTLGTNWRILVHMSISLFEGDAKLNLTRRLRSFVNNIPEQYAQISLPSSAF